MTRLTILTDLQGPDPNVDRLRDALMSELQRMSISAQNLVVSENVVPPGGTDLAVCLPARNSAPLPAMEQAIQTCLDAGVPVIPIGFPGVNFQTAFPELIREINALHWGEDTSPSPRMVHDLLRLTGLTPDERRVFISYRRGEGRRMAEQLWGALQNRGFEVFLDTISVPVGVNFQERLDEHLADKAFMLLLETPGASSSEWVGHEVTFARQWNLGLLCLTWPTVTAAQKFCEIPDGYRYQLVADSIVRGGRLRIARNNNHLKPILDRIEATHSEAMAMRHRETLESVQAGLQRSGLSFTMHDPWHLKVSRRNGSQVFLGAHARPPAAGELYDLDHRRSTLTTPPPEARLVHPGWSPGRREEITRWVTAGKPVRDVAVSAFVDHIRSW